jgi:5-formyltetrahydrofolate cyclo-ligase
MSSHTRQLHAARNAVRKAQTPAGVKRQRYARLSMASDDRDPVSPAAETLLRRRVKAELRKRMRGLRGALPAAACAERSARIVARLGSLDPVARARAVALFWPIEERHEVDLRALDASLRARGVRVAYPSADEPTRAMTFRFVADPATLTPQPCEGIRLLQPAPSDPEAAPGELDVIVVPALAADPSGQRIGYGAGYYDRTLPRFAPPATTVVVAFDFQLLAEAPSTEGDVRSDYIVTDARSLVASES